MPFAADHQIHHYYSFLLLPFIRLLALRSSSDHDIHHFNLELSAHGCNSPAQLPHSPPHQQLHLRYYLRRRNMDLPVTERLDISDISFARSFDLFYADVLGEASASGSSNGRGDDGALSDSSVSAAPRNSRQSSRRHKTEWRFERGLKSASGSPRLRWEEEEEEENAIAVSAGIHNLHSYCIPSSWEKHVVEAQQATAPENPFRSASAPTTSASSPALHRHGTCESNSIFPNMSDDREERSEWNHRKTQHADKICTNKSEIDMLKERFAKLLLGEDMSGGGNGVCSALAMSNAIADLSDAVFGKLQCLQPMREELKARWRREISWFLAVSDHIVEFHPSSQVLQNGNVLEIMITKPRSDLHMNLPALRKLDALLIEALDSFQRTEFWYVDRPMAPREEDGQQRERQEEKSWLPIPRVPSDGLSHNARKSLQRLKDNINQILKAALAINIQVLNEMEIPATYWDGLPKNARLSLGERLYHTITLTTFSPEVFVMSLEPGNNDIMLELLNRIEAALHVWRRKLLSSQTIPDGQHIQKMPWGYNVDGRARVSERRITLVKRAESLLLLLRQRFPGLPHTILDISKIECNKDVGQSILEGYSRALQNLARNILLRIDDVLHVDDLQKRKLLVKPEKPARLNRSCFRPGGPFICSFIGEASAGTFQKATNGTSASPRRLQTRFLGECMDPKMKVTIDATKQLQVSDGIHREM